MIATADAVPSEARYPCVIPYCLSCGEDSMNSRQYVFQKRAGPIVAVLSLVWIVCAGDIANAQIRGADSMPVEDASRSQAAVTGLEKTVATLQLANGATVDFVDLLD